jgi:uncharacterized membrane protein
MAHTHVLHSEPMRRTGERAERKANRVHWHAALTHFPISFFGAAFLFQVLHLFMFQKAFELSTTVCVLVGAFSLIPAIISGWWTWRTQYHGSKARIVRRKIVIAFVMLGTSVALSVWRVALYYLGSAADGVDHYAFFAFTALLIAAAILEGYYGGRLAHHDGAAVCGPEESDKEER